MLKKEAIIPNLPFTMFWMSIAVKTLNYSAYCSAAVYWAESEHLQCCCAFLLSVRIEVADDLPFAKFSIACIQTQDVHTFMWCCWSEKIKVMTCQMDLIHENVLPTLRNLEMSCVNKACIKQAAGMFSDFLTSKPAENHHLNLQLPPASWSLTASQLIG